MSLSPTFVSAEIHQPGAGQSAILYLHSPTETRRVDLRPAEVKVLLVLAAILAEPSTLVDEVRGFVSRQMLAERLRQDLRWTVEVQTISTHLERIRNKLGDASDGLLQTVQGRGIRVLLPITYHTPPARADQM